MALKSIIATVRGETVELEYNPATGYYEATHRAGADSSFLEEGHFFPVSIVATDDADLVGRIDHKDADFGNNLKLFVYEEKPPVVEITAPGNGSYITGDDTPTVEFIVRDNDGQATGFSGINIESLIFKIDGQVVDNSKISFEPIENYGYSCVYTPDEGLGNGEHTIEITVKDNDENDSPVAEKSFEIDIACPELVITKELPTVTSQSDVLVQGYATDKNTVTVDFYLNGGLQDSVDLGKSGGEFEFHYSLVRAGENEIRIVARDEFGNKSTEITRTIKYNTTAPIFEAVEIFYNNTQVSGTNKVKANDQYTIRCKVIAQ